MLFFVHLGTHATLCGMMLRRCCLQTMRVRLVSLFKILRRKL